MNICNLNNKKISARLSAIPSKDVGEMIRKLADFTKLESKYYLLQTTRSEDVAGCAFLIDIDENIHVLRFGDDAQKMIYMIEPLKIWDSDAILTVLP